MAEEVVEEIVEEPVLYGGFRGLQLINILVKDVLLNLIDTLTYKELTGYPFRLY